MAGPRLHVEIGALAWERHLLPNPDTPAGLRALLRRPDALNAFYGGCVFPDWGYEGIYDDAAEDSHWPPFWEMLFAGLGERRSRVWDGEGRMEVAFALGVVVHGVSDELWHFSKGEHTCFLDMVAQKDGLDHHTCEVACEVFTHLECPHREMPDLLWPVELVKQVYAKREIAVTEEQLARGRLKIERQWRKGAHWGWLAYPYYRLRYPWCCAHYRDGCNGAAGHGARAAAVRVLRVYRQWWGT